MWHVSLAFACVSSLYLPQAAMAGGSYGQSVPFSPGAAEKAGGPWHILFLLCAPLSC